MSKQKEVKAVCDELDRRDFLVKAAAIAVASPLTMLFPEFAQATTTNNFWTKDRVLNLARPQSKEAKSITYWRNGQWDEAAYKQVCWLLRDVVGGNVAVKMNVDLINSMFAQQEWLRMLGRSNPQMVIHSGFRTKAHNSRIEGAARNSEHLFGNAIDFHMKQSSINELLEMAHMLKIGGVGAYNTYIHLGVGSYRSWDKRR